MGARLTKEQLLEVLREDVVAPGKDARIAFEDVEFDSRVVSGGELFVALKGEKTHGHEFLQKAFDRGAALALVEDKKLLDTASEPERIIVVRDTLQSLSRLASWWRSELNIPVIGVTGSAGKTTVKELIAALLLKIGKGTYSLKSHNNHVGVPYTLLRIEKDHEWAVIEMGMNHAGEIRALSTLASPTIGIVTNIAPAHIQEFGTLDAIADAKLEILSGLKSDAVLITNGEDPVLIAGLKRHRGEFAGVMKHFGFGKELDASAENIMLKGLAGTAFQIRLGNELIPVEINILGKHNALNAACAVLAARTAFPKLSADQISSALKRFVAPIMRLNVKTVGGDESDEAAPKIIDDSYNANPASMRAALELASELRSSGKRVGLLLGDMLELGELSERYHLELGELAAGVKPEFVIAVGEFAAKVSAGCKRAGVTAHIAETPEAAASLVAPLSYDVLLVKGSRGVALDRAVSKLLGAP